MKTYVARGKEVSDRVGEWTDGGMEGGRNGQRGGGMTRRKEGPKKRGTEGRKEKRRGSTGEGGTKTG